MSKKYIAASLTFPVHRSVPSLHLHNTIWGKGNRIHRREKVVSFHYSEREEEVSLASRNGLIK